MSLSAALFDDNNTGGGGHDEVVPFLPLDSSQKHHAKSVKKPQAQGLGAIPSSLDKPLSSRVPIEGGVERGGVERGGASGGESGAESGGEGGSNLPTHRSARQSMTSLGQGLAQGLSHALGQGLGSMLHSRTEPGSGTATPARGQGLDRRTFTDTLNAAAGRLLTRSVRLSVLLTHPLPLPFPILVWKHYINPSLTRSMNAAAGRLLTRSVDYPFS